MIDWTKPVETTEDPPRPVRVLCTDAGEQYPIVALISREPVLLTKDGHEWPDGCGITLRNVPPPKPEPVLREGWVKLCAKDGQWPSASSSVFTSEDNACESVTMRKPLAICKVAWMSDGSPVPSEASGEDAPLIGLSDAEFRRLCDNVEAPLIADRDHWRTKAEALNRDLDSRIAECGSAWDKCDEWRTKAEALQAEVERMKPVVDAARVWAEEDPGSYPFMSKQSKAIMDVVRAYQSKQAPAEPVKNCTTCRFSCVLNKHLCAEHGFKEWEPRHD